MYLAIGSYRPFSLEGCQAGEVGHQLVLAVAVALGLQARVQRGGSRSSTCSIHGQAGRRANVGLVRAALKAAAGAWRASGCWWCGFSNVPLIHTGV